VALTIPSVNDKTVVLCFIREDQYIFMLSFLVVLTVTARLVFYQRQKGKHSIKLLKQQTNLQFGNFKVLLCIGKVSEWTRGARP
jgi:hypothetical protein